MSGDNFKWGVSIPEPRFDVSGEFFAALADHLHAILTSEGITEATASKAIHETLVRLSQAFAGEKIYITKNPANFARWLCAYHDLRYMDYRAVDRKYGWSQGYSLKIKEKIQALMQRRTQLRLPIEKS